MASPDRSPGKSPSQFSLRRALLQPGTPFIHPSKLFHGDKDEHMVQFEEGMVTTARDFIAATVLAAIPTGATQFAAGILFFKVSTDLFKGGLDLAQSPLASPRRYSSS